MLVSQLEMCFLCSEDTEVDSFKETLVYRICIA